MSLKIGTPAEELVILDDMREVPMSLNPNDKPLRDRKTAPATEVSAPITIGEMARDFDVSLRTLRFYEDRGLLVPRRVGTARLYTVRDKKRLKDILHLKHLGFTLTEIRDMMSDLDKRPAAEEVTLRPDQVSAQIAHLERQRQEIDGAIAALRNVQGPLETA